MDLGASAHIGQILIWNRTDCCWLALNDFWVFLSDTAFTAGDTPQTLSTRPGITKFHVTDFGTPTTYSLGMNAEGRYIRIQLNGTGNLNLAEVEVYGFAAQ